MLERAHLFCVPLALAIIVLPARGVADSPSGAAEKVSRSAEASGSAGARALSVEGPVYMGDQIKTNGSGEAQIRFVDNTRFVVGPNARVTIDKFVFAGTTARSVTLSAVRGAFRFITGKSPKNVYRIRTPVMTIGVRGTGLDGYVEPGTGRTTIALYEGQAELCDTSNRCQVIRPGCTIVVVPPGGGFQDPTATTRSRFLPYSISQASLLPDFRLDTSGCGRAAPPSRLLDERGGGGGGGSGGGGGDGDGGEGGGSEGGGYN